MANEDRARKTGEGSRDYCARMRETEKALSRQVQRGEMSVASGDAMAGIAGITNDDRAQNPINKDI